MIETIPSLQQVALRARLAQAAITLAKREAEKAVKQALKGRGLKPQYIPRREIVIMAKAYLAAHPELIAEVSRSLNGGAGRGSSANELRKPHIT
jgi:hypothetical protein